MKVKKRKKKSKLSSQYYKKTAKITAQVTGVLLGSLSNPTYDKYRFRHQIILDILEKYRKKKSFCFLVYHGLWMARKVTISPKIIATFRFLTGRPEKEMKQLFALYQALEKEQGTLLATQCLTEIARAVTLWEKKKNE